MLEADPRHCESPTLGPVFYSSGLGADRQPLITRNRTEALIHRRVYRPWGFYQSADSGSRYVETQPMLARQRAIIRITK
jgi:hypothetical protein